MYNQIILGVDPGSEMSGVCILADGQILNAFNVKNTELLPKVTNIMLNRNLIVAIEDIKAYSLRLTPGVIDTCKWIGELTYRLKNSVGCDCRLIARNEVKKWVFDRFPNVCLPAVAEKIKKSGFINANGEQRKQSFIFVDDKIVKESMTIHYKIQKPTPGKGYAYGLKDHSWQALSLCAFLEDKMKIPTVETTGINLHQN